MGGEELKKIIPLWAEEVGIPKARLALLKAGVGYTTAVFLIAGTYQSEPKGRIKKCIERALGSYLKKVS